MGADDWHEFVGRQFEAIRQLPRDWDSNGSDAPDRKLIDIAETLLSNLGAEGHLPKPTISPTRSGGVQFEWDANGRYFEVEITGENQVAYFYQDSEARVEESGTITLGEYRGRIRAYVDRIQSE